MVVSGLGMRPNMTVPFVEYILNPTIREGASKGEINAALTKKRRTNFFLLRHHECEDTHDTTSYEETPWCRTGGNGIVLYIINELWIFFNEIFLNFRFLNWRKFSHVLIARCQSPICSEIVKWTYSMLKFYNIFTLNWEMRSLFHPLRSVIIKSEWKIKFYRFLNN